MVSTSAGYTTTVVGVDDKVTPPLPAIDRKRYDALIDRLIVDVRASEKGGYSLRQTLDLILQDYFDVAPPKPELQLTATAKKDLVNLVAEALTFPTGFDSPDSAALSTARDLIEARFEVRIV